MQPTITLQTFSNNKLCQIFSNKKLLKITFILFLSLFSLKSVTAQLVYAVSSTGNLISFNAAAPGTVLSTMPFTGLTAGQTLQGLDFRPATGQLYALGYNASNGQTQIYTIKTPTGVATPVGTALTLATGMANLGFDFNPMVDRIRLTSSTGQNFRLNPTDGTLSATDGMLAYAAGDPRAGATPAVHSVAYTNSFGIATTTTLFFYDFTSNTIGTINPPNAGTLNTVGTSGITAANGTGLDLDITTNPTTGVNTAYLAANVSGSGNNFYSVNLTTGAATLIGAIGSGLTITEMAISLPAPPRSRTIYGISSGNLISFNSASPGTILSTVALSGLGTGETILGIDFRPATGELFALGSLSRLYTINLTTGAATQVGSNGAFTLSGTKFGFDFNPTVDRIRVTSDLDQNLRLNPNNGALAFNDGTLAYAAADSNTGVNPDVQAVAYTINLSGATTTELFFYDFSRNIIGKIDPPNAGTLNTVGRSGISAFAGTNISFDITTDQTSGINTAFLSASISDTATNLYRVNLTTGATSLVGAIGSRLMVSGIAVSIPAPPPAKLVYALSAGNLISFNSNAPANILSTMPLTGITAGQVVEGLDFRPATGQLYALGYNTTSGQAQVYTINIATGVATPVGGTVSLAAGMSNLSADFNPTVDRIRVISSTGQNYRLNPVDGTLAATDTPLSYAPGDVRAVVQPQVYTVAYTNNLASATTTLLYYYDFNLDQLATTLPPTSPNAGTLNTVGFSGLVTMNGTGLDLDITTNMSTGVNTAFLSANISDTASNFYVVDLTTGEARLIGTIGGRAVITEMAVSMTDVTLPITLLDFAAKKAGLTSELSWTTNNELNNLYFIIEKSANGSTFTSLDKVTSKANNGNSNLPLTYTYTDVAPLKGINYYRLYQVDKDGNKKFSQILRVNFDGITGMRIYPNPVKNQLIITGFLQTAADLQIKITDVSGKTVTTGKYRKQAGEWNVQMNVTGFSTGMYYVQVINGRSVIFTQSLYKD